MNNFKSIKSFLLMPFLTMQRILKIPTILTMLIMLIMTSSFISSKVFAVTYLNCATLWKAGFPIAAYKDNYPCYEYATVPSKSGTHHIYYSLTYHDLATNALKPEMVATMDSLVAAVTDSEKTYAPFGGFYPAAVIMTDISVGDAGAQMPVNQEQYPEPIAVFIYTASISEEPAIFKQNVAHELWHAFQFSNLHDGMRPVQAQWWEEGSANFFSNLVYPKANREFREANDYSWDTPLYLQPTPYSATDFFQSLANSWIGPQGVVDLLGYLPMNYAAASEPQRQWEGLASFPSIEMHFNNFAKEFSLQKIVDTGGGYLPTNYLVPAVTTVPDSGLSTTITPEPFTINEIRYALSAGKKWRLQTTNSQFNSPTVDIRDPATNEPWQILIYTPEYDLACYKKPKVISLLVTSATGPAVTKPFVQVTLESKDKICPCQTDGIIPSKYIGKWKLRDDSMKVFLSRSMKGGVIVDSVDGNVWLTITATHQFTFEHEHTVMEAHKSDGTLFHIVFTGKGALANLDISNTGQMCLTETFGEGTTDFTMTLPGQAPINSTQPMPAQFNEGVTYNSNLTGTVLTIKATILEGEPPSDFIFDRM